MPLCVVIGTGAIGRPLIDALRAAGHDVIGFNRSGSDRDGVRTLDEALRLRPALVIEVAGQAALCDIAPRVLAAGIDVVGASVGALADTVFRARLQAFRTTTAARLLLPHGAVGGLDYLATVSRAADLSVVYTSRKPVAAWRDELRQMGHDVDHIGNEVVLFEGDAVTAAQRYPRNLNAGLAVALAAGLDHTRVRVVADPTVRDNTHEVRVQSALGHAHFEFMNAPDPRNPKTSRITAFSVAALALAHLERASGG
ncbi:L-aspartate dehydrogenase [Ameyamaea chiangmaiensis NBRC 103196]|nr:aspartate dehydrogenase domain-containing protein [Ameyamaea chiangmaiensis]MBS4074212.1 DUF108 domain-containing protein [Ameyamaea chiangmaiensis]GBQ71262.1 L-aspartate dehydrogenase [Ameyamaea chiangmaiensis NBRC 103196]